MSLAKICVVSALVGVQVLLFLPGIASGQESERQARALQVVEHDGTEFGAYVDEKTSTPVWIIDVDSLDFSLGEPQVLSSRSQVVDASRAFLAAHAEAFGIGPKSLVFERAETDGRLWFIGYRQDYKGVPISNAEVGLTITREGRLVAAGIKAFPEVEADVTPELPAQSATQAARSRMGVAEASQSAPAELVIVPVDAGDRYEYRLAWRIRLDLLTTERMESRTYLIDASDERVIAEFDNVLDHAGVEEHSLHPPFMFAAGGTAGEPLGRMKNDALSELSWDAQETSGINSLWGYVKLNRYETPDNFT